MRVTPDPDMHQRLSLDERPRKMASRDYEWVKLSRRADACLNARRTGARRAIITSARPAFYD